MIHVFPGGPPGISSGPQTVREILGETFTDICAIQLQLVVCDLLAKQSGPSNYIFNRCSHGSENVKNHCFIVI